MKRCTVLFTIAALTFLIAIVSATAHGEEPSGTVIDMSRLRRGLRSAFGWHGTFQRPNVRPRGNIGEGDQHVKVCKMPGPCFKKTLICPKKCGGKLPGEVGVVGRHLPGQKCSFDCKMCTAHCGIGGP